MSVSDPLLIELKGYTKNLALSEGKTDDKNVITDDSDDLRKFCICLEKILYKGIKPRKTYWFPIKTVYEPWHWLENLGDSTRLDNILGTKPHLVNYRKIVPYSYQSACITVRQVRKVKSSMGKMRLLIRHCLVNRCLHVPFETLIKCGEQSYNYTSNSVLADEILMEILLSVLMQISRLSFQLDLRNNTFLDLTWYMPTARKYEFVPCSCLGLLINFIEDVAVITGIVPASVAAEEEGIEIGDVLSEINSWEITEKKRGKLNEILKMGAKEPVAVTIVKSYNIKTGEVFPAMLDILPQTQIDVPNFVRLLKDKYAAAASEVELLDEATNEESALATKASKVVSDISDREGYPVTYVGKVSTGLDGDVKSVGKAMDMLMQDPDSMCKQEVRIECQEIGIKVTGQEVPNVLLKNAYMEISSCGQTRKYPNYFAYIAGDDNVSCNIAKSFSCYIFHSENNSHIEEVLLSIGQGFKRTHFAV